MDPKLAGSIERLLTIYVTYLVTKYGSRIAGLDSAVPDIVVFVMSAISIGWSLFKNSKARMISVVAQYPEVRKVELSPTNPNTSALNEATPANVVVASNH